MRENILHKKISRSYWGQNIHNLKQNILFRFWKLTVKSDGDCIIHANCK
jgi:hypothetical protein